MNLRYPLATSSWDHKEIEAIHRVIASDQFSMGDEVASFEQLFASYFGVKYAVMVNSGSSANLLMTAALAFTKNERLKLSPGDEIIVPAVSWPTTYYPLSQYGLHLKFVDIDLHTLNYDLSALKGAVTTKTRAIMVVNLLGNPNDFDAIQSILGGRNIVVIEDNCESMGATFNNKHTGTFGIMGTFSCFFSHHISTMEGGVVVTDDEELYHIMLALRAHGWTRNLPKFNLVTGEKSGNQFEESFRFVLPGYNLRPLELSGAIGKEQLKKLPALINGRRKNGAMFQKKLSNNSKFLIQREIGESSWFGFSLVLRKEANILRDDLVRDLTDLGFECRPIVGGNFAKNEVMKFFDYSISGDLKNADYIDQNGLFVGNHHYDIEDAIDILGSL
ncbi:DegT/DnrJ/EryC1/StrS family aminotransferase [Roseobacter sp. HKCCD7870]|uniref:DegT/DnrJ/EryC1/StrS family aminotransferase n=1 Tax=Roseobacter sp. HKCCD7870 TaxID=3120343 RepID=UPI0030EC7EEC